MSTELPSAADVDPDEIGAPVLTKQGWVAPSPDSIRALDDLLRQAGGHADTSGARRDLEKQAAEMEARLRLKYHGDAQRLARLDALTQR